jgi:hypothetical protein
LASGYAQLSRFSFIGAGFWIVMVVGAAFVLVYAVGASRGKRAARVWTDACVAGLLIGAAVDIAWAVFSGEGRRFLEAFGVGPLLEMSVLAALFLGTMWFMAIRYTDGLKDD